MKGKLVIITSKLTSYLIFPALRKINKLKLDSQISNFSSPKKSSNPDKIQEEEKPGLTSLTIIAFASPARSYYHHHHDGGGGGDAYLQCDADLAPRRQAPYNDDDDIHIKPPRNGVWRAWHFLVAFFPGAPYYIRRPGSV